VSREGVTNPLQKVIVEGHSFLEMLITQCNDKSNCCPDVRSQEAAVSCEGVTDAL
jgi:hypothetical protein